jgi:hypothetical protein
MEGKMSSVEDAREAEDIVNSLYHTIGPRPTNMETYKQGYTWIVKYEIHSIAGDEEHRVHINAQTGKILRRE